LSRSAVLGRPHPWLSPKHRVPCRRWSSGTLPCAIPRTESPPRGDKCLC
jgi:hypothetical protein